MQDSAAKGNGKARANNEPGQMSAISLPKGGGAIRSIDEKFSVNPATGTVSQSIPIFTSPSRHDFHPQLSLSYDTGAGNGTFGLGWGISIPSITRKTDKGLPRYRDAEESDTFILSGAEDLVPVFKKDEEDEWLFDEHGHYLIDDFTRDGYQVRRYRPRTEGLFACIERWMNLENGDVHWRSISKNNITTLYGKRGDARIADPVDPTRVFSWLICESYDDKGNAILYEYQAENTAHVDSSLLQERNRLRDAAYAQRYLKRIKYGNRSARQVDDDLSLRDDWLFEVVFDYDEGHYELLPPDPDGRQCVNAMIDPQHEWSIRQDSFSSYRACFEIRTQRLCRRVLMFHRFAELGDTPCLVRSTEFTYHENPVLTYLAGATQHGYKRDAQTSSYTFKSFPPTEFGYTEARLTDEVRNIDARSLENLPVGLDNTRYQWLDLDGEGIAGILTEQAEGWYYKHNLGNGRFGPTGPVPTKPSLGDLQGGQARFMDLAGDGSQDVVLLDEPLSGFYERSKDESWDDFVPFELAPRVNWRDPNLRLVDITGDGHADVLITEDEVFTWYVSKGETGFGPGVQVPKALDDDTGPAMVFSDVTQSIYLADMSGDGLSDITRIKNGTICYWPNLGYGRFGARVTMDAAHHSS